MKHLATFATILFVGSISMAQAKVKSCALIDSTGNVVSQNAIPADKTRLMTNILQTNLDASTEIALENSKVCSNPFKKVANYFSTLGDISCEEIKASNAWYIQHYKSNPQNLVVTLALDDQSDKRAYIDAEDKLQVSVNLSTTDTSVKNYCFFSLRDGETKTCKISSRGLSAPYTVRCNFKL